MFREETIKNISNIMTISLNGLPLREWNSSPTVKKWLRANHTADDPRIKTGKIQIEGANQDAISKYLK